MANFSLDNHPLSLRESKLFALEKKLAKAYNAQSLKDVYSCIDVTTLNVTDNDENVKEFASWVNSLWDIKGMPSVAAICVYANYVSLVKQTIKAPYVKVACVAGNFPSSQSKFKFRLEEIVEASNDGADEIDVVINVGYIKQGKYKEAEEEIRQIRKAINPKVHLKVIIESGAYSSHDEIYNASMAAMMGGADFIKTSTGKIDVSATPMAALIMCLAIKDYEKETGKKVGFKAAGGIRTGKEALMYLLINQEILGEDHSNCQYFRIGASSLVKNILKEIEVL